MSCKNILNQFITMRLMELYEEHEIDKALEIISKEICEALNCEPINFINIEDKKDTLVQLDKIICVLEDAHLTNTSVDDVKKVLVCIESLKELKNNIQNKTKETIRKEE